MPDPTPETIHVSAIATLKQGGDFAGAQRYCRQALEQDPGSALLWEQLGRTLQSVGKFDEAAHALGRSLEIQPSGIASLLLAKMRSQAQADEMQKIACLVEDQSLGERDRIAAGFALGDLLDQAGRFDEAFSAYSFANAGFKKLAALNSEYFVASDLRNYIDQIMERFTLDSIRQRCDFGQSSDLPVFVVGHPRSGSSLVEQILASHSKVFGAGEITDIGEIRVRLSQLIQPDSPRHMQRHWHRQQANLHLAKLAMRAPGAHRVVDKMLANIFNLGLIATLFPKARIIHCHRDPRDTGLSCFFQLFENYNLLFSYDLADCATYQREIDRLSAHWKRVLELRTLDVDYEQLIANPQEQTRRLIDFVGLDWEPNCLEFHKTDRPVLTRSFWQVRQPIYTQSINRWKNYERHLGPLAALVGAAD